jgi:hypothetical protein
MKRLPSLWRNALHIILLSAILLYTLLPAFGWVWHEVVPEHDHWLIGKVEVTQTVTTELTYADDPCVNCLVAPTQETVIHAFNPASALQSFIVFVVLMPLGSFVALRLWSQPLGLMPLWRKAIWLPLLDPPPESL